MLSAQVHAIQSCGIQTVIMFIFHVNKNNQIKRELKERAPKSEIYETDYYFLFLWKNKQIKSLDMNES